MHAEVLPWTIRLRTLVLIAQAIFLLEHNKQTDKQTQLNALLHAGTVQLAWVMTVVWPLQHVYWDCLSHTYTAYGHICSFVRYTSIRLAISVFYFLYCSHVDGRHHRFHTLSQIISKIEVYQNGLKVKSVVTDIQSWIPLFVIYFSGHWMAGPMDFGLGLIPGLIYYWSYWHYKNKNWL